MPDLARIRGSAIFLVLCCGKDAEFTFWPLLSPVSNFQPPSTEKRAESFYVDILLVEDSAPMRKLVATIVKRMGSERARGPERRRSSSCCSRRRWTWCSRIGACRSWTARPWSGRCRCARRRFLGHVPAKPTNNIPFRGAGRRAQWKDTSQKLNSAAQKLTDD